MNILIFEDSSQSSYGGGQKISKIVIDSLRREHKVYISDYTDNSFFQNDISSLHSGSITLPSKYFSNKFLNRFFQLLYLPISLIILKSFIKKNKIELYCATTKLSLFTVYILHKLTKVNYVYHAHMAFDKGNFDKIYSLLLSKSQLIIAVSNFVKYNILSFGKELTVKVLYNPIEFTIGNNKSIQISNDFIIAFFGTIKTEKGVNVLMDVAEYFSSKHSFVKFWVFGEGIMLDKLKNEQKSNVKFFGHVSDVEYYLESYVNLLLLPSIIPEACPTIILQSFSKGIPVITTNIGGQNEIVKDSVNGFVVPINCSESIVEKINILIENPEIYKRISCNNLKKSAEFNDLNQYQLDVLQLINSTP